MTTQELITLLRDLPPNAEVFIEAGDLFEPEGVEQTSSMVVTIYTN